MRTCRILIVLAASVTVSLFAQTDEIELTRSLIQTERQAIIAKNLELTEAEAEEFWPAFRAYRGELTKLGDRALAMIKSYAEAYNADSMTDAKADALIKEYLSIEEAELKLKKRWWKKFRKILSARKAARYFQLENKLDAVVDVDLADQIPLIP